MKANINKVRSFLQLQEKINNQIDKRGRCTEELAADLERIGSSLNSAEIDLVCRTVATLRSKQPSQC